MSCISENKNLIFKNFKTQECRYITVFFFLWIFLINEKNRNVMHFQARFSQIEKMRLLLYTSNKLNGQVFLH